MHDERLVDRGGAPGGGGPDEAPRPPQVPRTRSRYAWLVAAVVLMGIGVLLITSAAPDSGEGLSGPRPGAVVPDFAAPLATGSIDGAEANVRGARDAGKGAGSVPACEVRGKDVVNVCRLREKPLVLTFVVTRGVDCKPQVDRVERMRRELPHVNFAVVVSGEAREEVEQVVRRRGWSIPVAVDEQGAVVDRYRVGVCPTTVFARAGGRVRTTRLGNLTERQLRTEARKLLEG